MEIILIIGSIVIGIFFLRLALAWLVPIEKTGKALLEQELKQYGINHQLVPHELKTEIVNQAITIAGVAGQPKSAAFKSKVVEHIQFQAEHLKNFIKNPNMFSQSSDDPFQKAYEKYDLSNL